MVILGFFGIWTVEHCTDLGSQSITETASWILIHLRVEHLRGFCFRWRNFTAH